MQVAGLLGDVDQAVVDGGGADGAAEIDRAGPSSGRGSIGPPKCPDQRRVLVGGILGVEALDGDTSPVLVMSMHKKWLTRVAVSGAPGARPCRCRACCRGRPAWRRSSCGRASAARPCAPVGIAVELPDQLAGRRLEAVEPAVAAGEDDLRLAVDLGVGRVGPLAFDDLVAGQVVLPGELAGLLVDGDEARRLGRRRLCPRRRAPLPVTTKTRSPTTSGEQLREVVRERP